MNWSAWFEKEGISYVKHLVNEDAAAILKLGAAQRAVVRRIVVAKVSRHLWDAGSSSSFKSARQQAVATQVRQVPW